MRAYRYVFFTFLLCLGIFLGQRALASSFEWISLFYINDPWVSLSNSTTTWTVTTSDNFYEYRSVYYVTTTDMGWGPTATTTWQEFTECRHEGYVNTETNDSCEPTAPYTDSSVYLWIRITTNFSGCGTWTPNPSASCGDYKEKRVNLNAS